MRVFFVHDHMFKTDGYKVYSDKLPYTTWQRYLKHFDSLTVFARYSYETTDISKQSLSSGENVYFEFAPSISSIRAFLGRRQEQKKRLEKLIQEHDVVIARNSSYATLAIQVCKQLNKPYVLEVVGCPWDALWNYGNIKGRLMAPVSLLNLKLVAKSSKYIHYVSQNFLQQRYPHRKDAIVLQASNVEISTPSENVLSNRIQKINSENKKIVFGLIGSFKTKYKGIHNAIPVLAKLAKEYPNIELRILGSGDTTEYNEIAEINGFENKVFFDGVIPTGEPVFNWLDNIDIYIQPSYQEGVPRALIEAMSRGCPSIASSAGGIPELLDKDLIFSPGNENKFYEILEKNIFSIEWRIKQAKKNFEKSKEYQKDILDKRRFDFFEKVKNS